MALWLHLDSICHNKIHSRPHSGFGAHVAAILLLHLIPHQQHIEWSLPLSQILPIESVQVSQHNHTLHVAASKIIQLHWDWSIKKCVPRVGVGGREWILTDMLVLPLRGYKRGVFNAQRFILAGVSIVRFLSCLCRIPWGLTAPTAHTRCHYFLVGGGHFRNLISLALFALAWFYLIASKTDSQFSLITSAACVSAACHWTRLSKSY